MVEFSDEKTNVLLLSLSANVHLNHLNTVNLSPISWLHQVLGQVDQISESKNIFYEQKELIRDLTHLVNDYREGFAKDTSSIPQRSVVLQL